MDYRIYPGLVADEKTIIKTVYEYFGLKENIKDTGKGKLKSAKQMSLYLLHKKYGLTVFAIKGLLGIDESTTTYNCKIFNNYYATDKNYKLDYDNICEKLDKYKDINLKKYNTVFKTSKIK